MRTIIPWEPLYAANSLFEHCECTGHLFGSCSSLLAVSYTLHMCIKVSLQQIWDCLNSDSLQKPSVAYLSDLGPGSPQHLYGFLSLLFFLSSLCYEVTFVFFFLFLLSVLLCDFIFSSLLSQLYTFGNHSPPRMMWGDSSVWQASQILYRRE